jgi:hypothetical protein
LIPDFANNKKDLNSIISQIDDIISDLKKESDLIDKFSKQCTTLEAREYDLIAFEILKAYDPSVKNSKEFEDLLKK